MAIRQAAKARDEVRGLLVPLDGFNLVVPDSVVLQVLSAKEYTDITDGPKWLMGIVDWQKHLIPVLSFEVAAGRNYEKPEDMLLLVLKSLNDREKIPFYAFFLSGIPHPVRFDQDNLSAVEKASSGSPLILAEVLVYGEQSSIPNLDVLEEMLMSQYDFLEGYFKEFSED